MVTRHAFLFKTLIGCTGIQLPRCGLHSRFIHWTLIRELPFFEGMQFSKGRANGTWRIPISFKRILRFLWYTLLSKPGFIMNSAIRRLCMPKPSPSTRPKWSMAMHGWIGMVGSFWNGRWQFFQVGTCAKCTARLKLPRTASNLWICHRISSMKAREDVVFNDFGRSSDSELKYMICSSLRKSHMQRPWKEGKWWRIGAHLVTGLWWYLLGGD